MKSVYYTHLQAQYQENLKIYHNSAQYQNYLREKQRAEHQIEEEERRAKAVSTVNLPTTHSNIFTCHSIINK